MKAWVIAISIICAVMVICGCACAQAELRPEFYPKLAIVASCTRIGDTPLYAVNCIDRNGNEWGFFDDEGLWKQGDIANLLMWATTDREEEDEVVEVYWEGYTENVTEWLHNNGWR